MVLAAADVLDIEFKDSVDWSKELACFAQPVFRFSAAQEPQEEKYAPALAPAACTDACACVKSGGLKATVLLVQIIQSQRR